MNINNDKDEKYNEFIKNKKTIGLVNLLIGLSVVLGLLFVFPSGRIDWRIKSSKRQIKEKEQILKNITIANKNSVITKELGELKNRLEKLIKLKQSQNIARVIFIILISILIAVRIYLGIRSASILKSIEDK